MSNYQNRASREADAWEEFDRLQREGRGRLPENFRNVLDVLQESLRDKAHEIIQHPEKASKKTSGGV